MNKRQRVFGHRVPTKFISYQTDQNEENRQKLFAYSYERDVAIFKVQTALRTI